MRWTFIAVSLLAAVAWGSPASAITCKGNFQIQRDGSQIATPYCQDTYLAAVAREYGMAVSARAVRANPSVKERACRFVGDDNRVRDTCVQYRWEDDPHIPLR